MNPVYAVNFSRLSSWLYSRLKCCVFLFQSFIVSLSGVTGGARIGGISSATVTILANDNPYGFVAFESPVFITNEEDSTSTAVVPVLRR